MADLPHHMCSLYSPSHFFRAVLICNPSPIIAFAFALIGNMLGIVINKFGADSGSRTHAYCLEGSSTSRYTTPALGLRHGIEPWLHTSMIRDRTVITLCDAFFQEFTFSLYNVIIILNHQVLPFTLTQHLFCAYHVIYHGSATLLVYMSVRFAINLALRRAYLLFQAQELVLPWDFQ